MSTPAFPTSTATATAGSASSNAGRQAKRYLRSCVDWPRDQVDALNAMIEAAQPITLATFRRHVDARQLAGLLRNLGYATRPGEPGLRLSRDWHVGYRRSVLLGAPVVFLVHSAIEHVFAADPDVLSSPVPETIHG